MRFFYKATPCPTVGFADRCVLYFSITFEPRVEGYRIHIYKYVYIHVYICIAARLSKVYIDP